MNTMRKLLKRMVLAGIMLVPTLAHGFGRATILQGPEGNLVFLYGDIHGSLADGRDVATDFTLGDDETFFRDFLHDCSCVALEKKRPINCLFEANTKTFEGLKICVKYGLHDMYQQAIAGINSARLKAVVLSAVNNAVNNKNPLFSMSAIDPRGEDDGVLYDLCTCLYLNGLQRVGFDQLVREQEWAAEANELLTVERYEKNMLRKRAKLIEWAEYFDKDTPEKTFFTKYVERFDESFFKVTELLDNFIPKRKRRKSKKMSDFFCEICERTEQNSQFKVRQHGEMKFYGFEYLENLFITKLFNNFADVGFLFELLKSQKDCGITMLLVGYSHASEVKTRLVEDCGYSILNAGDKPLDIVVPFNGEGEFEASGCRQFLGGLEILKGEFLRQIHGVSRDAGSAAETSTPAAITHSCAVCGNTADKKCGKCKVVWYCSRACQGKDWKAGHRAACQPQGAAGAGAGGAGK